MRFSLKSAILIVFQLLLILVPLTWTSSTSELFEFPKMMLTYAGVIIIASLWMARMVSTKTLIFKHTPFEIPILLFLGSQVISTFLSIDIHTSLFGYYSRFNGGLLSLLAYAVLYFAAVSNFNRRDAHIILKTLVFTGIMSSLYAFPEHFGHSPSCLMISGKFTANCWVQDVQSRVFGTFGQPNWLAGYLVVILPLTLFATVYQKNTTKRLIAAGIFALFLATIIFTKSQSGIGATAVAILISAVIIAVRQKKTAILLALIPLFAALFFVKQTAVKNTLNSLQNINPFYSTTADIVAKDLKLRGNGGTDSMVIRRVVWQGAWELAKKHPLFGTGVETFAYSYYNVRPVEHNLVSEWDFLYNKAHNEFLNYAATTGFIGLATYLIFLGSFILWSLKIIKHGKYKSMESKENIVASHTSNTSILLVPQLPALLAGFLALCISNFFGFSTVPVNTLLFLFPALAFLLSASDTRYKKSPEGDRQVTSNSGSSTILYLVTCGLCLYLLSLVYKGFAADKTYAIGKSAGNNREYQKAVDKLQQAVKAAPNEPLYTDELAQTASEVAVILSQSNQPGPASEAAKIAIELSNRTLNLNRVHLNFYKTRAKVFINLAAINPAYAVEAGATLDAAIRLAPTDAKLWFNRALLTEQLGYQKESMGIFEKAIALKPNYELARYQYGQLLTSLSDTDGAKIQYQYILDHINPNNMQVQTALTDIATKAAVVKSIH